MLIRIGAALLALAGAARGQDWFSPDSPSRGLGGAGVASTTGPMASFWNQANLAQGAEGVEFITAGLGAAGSFFADITFQGNIVQTINDLAQVFVNQMPALQNSMNGGTATAAQIQTALGIVSQITTLGTSGQGVLADVGGSLEVKMGTFGVFYRMFGHAAITPFYDLTTLSALAGGGFGTLFTTTGTGGVPTAGTPAATLSAQLQTAGVSAANANEYAFLAEQALGSSLGGPTTAQALYNVGITTQGAPGNAQTLLFNGSGVNVRGIVFAEAGVSAGVPAPWFPFVTLGGSLKDLVGATFQTSIPMRDMTDANTVVNDLLASFYKNAVIEHKFNMDLSAGVTLLGFVNAGISARNVIPTSFRFADGTTYDVNPQVRMGASASLGFVKLSLDADLTENIDSALAGYKSRLIAAGAQFEFGGFLVNAGLFDNLADLSTRPVWAGALGFSLGPVFLNVSAQLAFSDVTINPPIMFAGIPFSRVPQRFSLAASAGFDLKF